MSHFVFYSKPHEIVARRRRTPFASLSCAAASMLVLTLGACGGGGGGSGGSSVVYAIGGDLTGLASGQQITLHNGVEALQLTTNGTFTFSSKVANGGQYAVTVVAQPVGQTCIVVNGTGTAVNANVSNVSVTCTYLTFTLGGNVTGLPSGQQVTLQNNGADSITLAANGTFTFSTPSHYFDIYSVSVSAQPGPSNEFCSITNGGGSISGSVTNVLVTCATEVVLYNFTSAGSANGINPEAALFLDGAGNIFGTTSTNVFELVPANGGGYTESVLYDSNPQGGVIMDSAGDLYGTALFGGSGSFGTVFKLSPLSGGGYTESILHDFSGTTLDGGQPAGDLLMDGTGNLYGTTRLGGLYQGGTVFKLSPSPAGGYDYSILYSFTGTTMDGGEPNGGLIMDSAGNLYGTTMTASPVLGAETPAGFGTVFKLAPTAGGTYTETTLHLFSGFDGVSPAAGLTMDSSGNLYDTTNSGSGNPGIGYGLVFKLTPDVNGVYTLSILYSFTGGSDGGGPLSALVMDHAGNFYGTASVGGGGTTNCNNGCGTIFRLSLATSGNYTETTLYSFAGGSGGGGPAGSLIMDAAGNLYGTTFSGNGINVSGGADAGNVFEILLH